MEKKYESEKTITEFFALWRSVENIVEMLPLLETIQAEFRWLQDRVNDLENVKPLYITELEKENKNLKKRIKSLEVKIKEKEKPTKRTNKPKLKE